MVRQRVLNQHSAIPPLQTCPSQTPTDISGPESGLVLFETYVEVKTPAYQRSCLEQGKD
jgi:hypothetical protein